MKACDERYLDDSLRSMLQGRPSECPADWAIKHFVFDESNNHGPFRMSGNEYVADVLNDFNRQQTINDITLVWGSQTKKTGTLMAGLAWRIVNDPCGILWVMPNEILARRFSRQRLQKAFRATPPVANIIPAGALRAHFSTLEMLIGGSTLNFSGSNSPANVASSPCALVIMDEMDKFGLGEGKEADSSDLAAQRTKDQVNPQRWRTSTPTLSSGLIWQEYLKGNQMRYHLPCPHCAADVLLAWSKRFTVLPLRGCEAFIRWDPKSKLTDGWDLDRVKMTAHAVCPHCQGPIGNEHKTAMVRRGCWQPTNLLAASSYVSRHLSSLYSTSPETSFGVLAVKFLQAKNSLQGLQGFINGDLAEPMEAQDTLGDRVELVTPRVVKSDYTKLITVDCQARAPYFWWVCREWGPGISRGVECGSADTWEDLDAIQDRLGVAKEAVAVDSGFGARSDAEVYGSCVRRAEIMPQERGLPIALGWVPTKGFPGRRLYKDPETELMRPYYLRDVDPFEGSSDAGRVRIGLIGFSTDYAKDLLDGLRRRQGHGVVWSVSEGMNTEEYWRHMDAEIKEAVRSRATGFVKNVWKMRAQRWPNHWLDCEVLQVIFASYLGLLDIGPMGKAD